MASLAMTLPIALSSARSASAGALVTPRTRTTLLDALRTPELIDAQGEPTRAAVDEVIAFFRERLSARAAG